MLASNMFDVGGQSCGQRTATASAEAARRQQRQRANICCCLVLSHTVVAQKLDIPQVYWLIWFFMENFELRVTKRL